MKTTVDQAVSS